MGTYGDPVLPDYAELDIAAVYREAREGRMTVADQILLENYLDEVKHASKAGKHDRAKAFLFKALAIVTIRQQEKSPVRPGL